MRNNGPSTASYATQPGANFDSANVSNIKLQPQKVAVDKKYSFTIGNTDYTTDDVYTENGAVLAMGQEALTNKFVKEYAWQNDAKNTSMNQNEIISGNPFAFKAITGGRGNVNLPRNVAVIDTQTGEAYSSDGSRLTPDNSVNRFPDMDMSFYTKRELV